MITIQNVTKRYGDRAVVDDVSFTVPGGSVTAFLGPNGAGKSTTMRILAGLTRADTGTAHVAGRPIGALPNSGRVVGLMLDASALHRGRTCLETVRLAATVTGVGEARAREVLAAVGLESASGRRVGACSMGMRQRLGLAVALVGRPRALVLDEPFNGLDPEAIHELRGVLRDFAASGGAVLLSSHLLGEVQAAADRLVVLVSGRLVAEGPADELAGDGITRVRADRSEDLHAALVSSGLAATPLDGGWFAVEATPARVGQLTLAAGVPLTGLGEGQAGLEELFLSLTSAPTSPTTSAATSVPADESTRAA